MLPPAKFTVAKPVLEADVPIPINYAGRTSPYAPLYGELCKLRPDQFIPVTVAVTKAGYGIAGALRKMADREGKALEQRRSSDGLTFFFRLIAKEPETK